MSKILEGLNPAQREAVIHYNTPSLIIAGAGSGKTRVLTSRIAYMLEQGVRAENILALTFTKKAANEMRERIDSMVGTAARRINMGTFHSIFARILRENAEAIGFKREFTIYETTDSKNLIKTIIKERNLDDNKYKPGLIHSRISTAKNSLITPGAYAANAALTGEDRSMQIPEFSNIYIEYCRRCKQNNAMDFDDLLLQTNILLRDCPEILRRYQELFQYILVDEYQDTNYAQYLIVRRLSQLHGRVCVVGDDAQSIYSFRGAKIENILSFQRDYPQAEVFKLEQNYRSTQTIVDAANSVIKHNARQMQKQCFSAAEQGEKIRIFKAYTDREEAELVVTDLRDRVREGGDDWQEAAILYRTNNQSRVLEDALRRKGIPYKIYKGNSFYNHVEIKELLGYFRLIVNPKDDEAFKRVINTPARGIGDTTVDRIAAIAKDRDCSMWEAIDTLVQQTPADSIEKVIVRKVTDFVSLIRTLALEREQKSVDEFGREVTVRSGLRTMYSTKGTPEAQSAVDNIDELLNSMQEYTKRFDDDIKAGVREEFESPTVDDWLQNVMLMTDMDNEDPESNNKVTLMTVHSAKGLEYKYVYVVGCEEELFPAKKSLESLEGLEEERRLFYVALTRAKTLATLTCVDIRNRVWGNGDDRSIFSTPSRFLTEIDAQYVESDFDLRGTRRNRELNIDEGEDAITTLRRRYDVRSQQKRSQNQPFRPQSQPKPQPQETPKPSYNTERMRRVESSASGATTTQPCSYTVGQRVNHPKFGNGTIVAIEALATDHKLKVDFGAFGEKTLLAKLAKLTVL